MVNHHSAEVDAIFQALSDSTRRSMMLRLCKGELSVTELAEPYEISLAAVSKHLKVLEGARIVEKTKTGRVYRCRANLEPLSQVHDILEELGAFWRGRLDSLEQFFSNEKRAAENKNDQPTNDTGAEQCKPKRKKRKRRR